MTIGQLKETLLGKVLLRIGYCLATELVLVILDIKTIAKSCKIWDMKVMVMKYYMMDYLDNKWKQIFYGTSILPKIETYGK